ncbi:hypothetical protein [uncultured Gammaproteobacteria bacterium]|nr:hypothetical protein [uncultured Gammaproteobacteria bacterium]
MQTEFNLEGKPTQAGTLSGPYLRGIYNSLSYRWGKFANGAQAGEFRYLFNEVALFQNIQCMKTSTLALEKKELMENGKILLLIKYLAMPEKR